ncbi:MAG TPA: flagellar hook-length control protein FliK, partial [Ramlibacter sp.]
ASKGAGAGSQGDSGSQQGSDAQTPALVQFQAAATSTTASADRAGATGAASTPVLTVAPEVGNEAWAPALAQQMLRMSASGQHVARLNLNPAELGPLQVTLSMNDHQTQAMFMSSHEGVRKALEAALPQLRTTLASQGIELSQASVGSGSQQQFTGQGNSFAGNQDSPRSRVQADYPGAARTESQPAPAANNTAPRVRSHTGLDTFA